MGNRREGKGQRAEKSDVRRQRSEFSEREKTWRGEIGKGKE